MSLGDKQKHGFFHSMVSNETQITSQKQITRLQQDCAKYA